MQLHPIEFNSQFSILRSRFIVDHSSFVFLAPIIPLSFPQPHLTMATLTRSARSHGELARMTVKYIIRHGVMRFLGDFEPMDGTVFPRGSDVIIRTERGQEAGQVLCEASPE